MTPWRLFCAMLVVCGIGLENQACADTETRPNIVILLADDMGFGDLNAEVMPRSLQLAETGSRLNFYTMQNCTPTRAALMTGKMPVHFNLHGVWPTPIEVGLPPEEKLLSEHMHDAGYRTGIFGKWHLGWKSRDQWPMANGFDEFIGCLGGHLNSYGSLGAGMPYEDGTTGHDHHLIHDFQWNGTPLYTSRYSTFVFRDAAIRFIRQSAGAEEPFFLYVPFNAPHGPFAAPREYVERAATLPDVDASVIPQLGTYAGDVMAVPYGSDNQLYLDSNQLLYKAMVMALDDAVADIHQSLVDSGIADNTLFLFASDNGPSYTKATHTEPRRAIGDNAWLRDFKGGPYEGGHFVANFLVWPNRIEPGQLIESNVWIGDVMPTCLDLAGIEIPSDVDGGSMVSAIDSNSLVNRNFGGKRIYPHIQKKPPPNGHPDKTLTAVGVVTINRRWQKYVRRVEFDAEGFVNDQTIEEFYDLRFDPSETNDVSDEPAYARLMRSMRASYESLGGNEFMEGIEVFDAKHQWAGFVVTQEFAFDDNPLPLQTDLNP